MSVSRLEGELSGRVLPGCTKPWVQSQQGPGQGSPFINNQTHDDAYFYDVNELRQDKRTTEKA